VVCRSVIYDFRRTEQCIIPYATQEGEISFCAYNTGVGWRNIVEKMHMTATLTKWYEEHGGMRSSPAARRSACNPPSIPGSERRDRDQRSAARPRQTGHPKTAREEKMRARDQRQKKVQEEEENAK